jgi:glycosyltransferase involved in cell wall biosynthesis
MATPAFTVVITTFDRSVMVTRAVDSVLAQTCKDFELIVVDDGSTDDTPAALRAYEHDPRVQCLRIEHSGVSRARNFGMQAGTGEWIAVLDDDNLWKPGYLEHQLALARAHPDAGVVYCSAEQYEADGRLVWIWPGEEQPRDPFGAMLGHWFTWVSATVFRRSLLEEVGGFEPALDTREDKDMLLRLAARTRFVGSADTLMVRWLHGEPRLTDHTLTIMRVGFELDRRWQRTIRRRYGTATYARFFHGHIGRPTVRAVLLTPPERRRAVAAEASRLLARRLPWSATTLPFPLLLVALGPSRYQALRASYRRWFPTGRVDPEPGSSPAPGEHGER